MLYRLESRWYGCHPPLIGKYGDDVFLWLDDIRKMPAGYTHHARSVNEAKRMIIAAERRGECVELLDLDHDLGDYAYDGGDGIRLIDWLLERGTLYRITLHTANPVGRANMQRMIDRFW